MKNDEWYIPCTNSNIWLTILLYFVIYHFIQFVKGECSVDSYFTEIESSSSYIIYTKLKNNSLLVMTSNNFIMYSDTLVELNKVSHSYNLTEKGNIIQLENLNYVYADGTAFYILNKDTFEVQNSNTNWISAINNCPFISLTPLSSGNFMIAASKSEDGTVAIFNPLGEQKSSAGESNVYYDNFDCIELEHYILCARIDSIDKKNTYFDIYDKTLNTKNTVQTINAKVPSDSGQTLEPQIHEATEGIRVMALSGDEFLFALMKNYSYFYSSTGKVTGESTIIKTSHITDIFFSPVSYCNIDIKYTSLAVLDSTHFAVTCKERYVPSALLYSKIRIDSGIEYYDYSSQCITDTGSPESSYSKSFFFSSSGILGIFYSSDSSIKLRLFNYPQCKDYLVTSTEVLAGSTGTLNFANYYSLSHLANSTNATSVNYVKFSLHDIYNSSLSSVTIYTSSNIEVNSVDSYSLSTFTYNVGSTTGIITYSFSILSNVGEDGKYCRLIFKVKGCYESCANCSVMGDIDDNKCLSCAKDRYYYPPFNDTTQCWEKTSSHPGYYMNMDNETFSLCNEGCSTCNQSGTVDATNCMTCNEGESYYPVKTQEEQCYKYEVSTAIDYYYYGGDHFFYPCETGCLTCSGPKDATSMNCLSCDQSDSTHMYYPTVITPSDGMCYDDTTKPENYFLNTDKYEECNLACKKCTTKDATNTSNTLCTECATNYYPIESNTSPPLQCYEKDSPPPKYYYGGGSYFEKCDDGCLTCDQKGSQDVTMNNTKCTSCDEDNNYVDFSEGFSGLCYKKTLPFDRYVYSTSQEQFIPCTLGCLTCTITTSDTIECNSCDTINNYFPITVSPTVVLCHKNGEDIDGYYYDEPAGEYKPCYEGCRQCNEAGNEAEPNCKNYMCNADYYPIKEKPSTCWKTDVAHNKGFLLNGERQYIPCASECLTCSQESTLLNTNCDECYTTNGYYPLSNDTTQCVNEDTKPQNSFFDTNQYTICYESCLECSALGDATDGKCTLCYDDNGYHLIEIGSTKKCINDAIRDTDYPSYFYSVAYNKYIKCSVECNHCEISASMCIDCNTAGNYHEVEMNMTGGTIICKDDTIKQNGYYLDTDSKYKKCYSTCKLCDRGGDDTTHNCNECILNYIPHPGGLNQCVMKCNYYFYVDTTDNSYHCTPSKNCPSSYSYLLPDTKECVASCSSPRYTFESEKECLLECPNDTAVEGSQCKYLDICRKTEYEVSTSQTAMSGNIDVFAKSYCDEFTYTNKHVNIINHQDELYQVVIYKDETCAKEFVVDLAILDLAGCPEKLRDKYSIPDDIPLTVLKMSIARKGQTDQLSYAFYNSQTGERLDLSICAGEKVEVIVSMNTTKGVNITQAEQFASIGVDVYNSSDPFFNDVCFPFTSEDGKDVTLDDRRVNYYQNVSFCEAGCTYNGVNLNTQEANCTCEVKTNFVDDILDNPLTGEFLDLINDANFEVLYCYRQVFNFTNIKTNVGGWIIFGIGVIEIGVVILYAATGLMGIRIYLLQFMKINPPKNEPTNILTNFKDDETTPNIPKSNLINVKNERRNIQTNENLISEGEDNAAGRMAKKMLEEDNVAENMANKILTLGQNEQSINNNNITITTSTKRNEDSPVTLLQQKPKKVLLMLLNHNEKDSDRSFNNDIIEENDTVSNKSSVVVRRKKKKNHSGASTMPFSTNRSNIPLNEKSKLNINGKLSMEQTITNNNANITNEADGDEEYSDSELNNLDLYDAIIYDKRPFCVFYWRQLREKQSIINTFFVYDILEPYPIKILCFFFGIALYFTLNALFYTESEISDQFTSSGVLAMFKTQLSRCLYSSMVGIAVSFLLGCLSSSKARVKSLIKRERNPDKFREESIVIVNSLRKKTLAFIIINLILMCLFWYYVSAFCYCYQNSQIGWLTGGLITWGITLVFPFLLCFLIAVFRYIGIKYKMDAAYRISSCLSD